jgi:hypothetical protein
MSPAHAAARSALALGEEGYPPLRLMDDLYDAMRGNDYQAAKFTNAQIAAFATPAIVRDVAKLQDYYYHPNIAGRHATTLKEKAMSALPKTPLNPQFNRMSLEAYGRSQ